jgi:hypothetical protein
VTARISQPARKANRTPYGAAKFAYVSLAVLGEVLLSGSGCLYVWSNHLEVPIVDVWSKRENTWSD